MRFLKHHHHLLGLPQSPRSPARWYPCPVSASWYCCSSSRRSFEDLFLLRFPGWNPRWKRGFEEIEEKRKYLAKNTYYRIIDRGYWKESLRSIFHWKHWNGILKKYLETLKNRWMQCRLKPIASQGKGDWSNHTMISPEIARLSRDRKEWMYERADEQSGKLPKYTKESSCLVAKLLSTH